MKPLFKRLPAITHSQIFQPLKRTLLTLLFTVPQVPIQYPLLGSISSGGKALAQAQTSCPAGTSPGTIEWNPTTNLQDFLSQNLSVGGISTTFRFDESIPGGVIDQGETRIEQDRYGDIAGPNLRFNIGGNSLGRSPNDRDNSPAPAGSRATLTITFAQPVTLASPLTLLDIDRDGQRDLGRIYQDRVTVTAFNGNTPVGVTGTAVSPNNTRVTNQGNSVLAVGINENAQTTESNGNILVTPAGAITEIRVLYQPGEEFGSPPGQDETIGLARINICAPVPGGTLGDTVYNDTNGNSIQDTGETGISGVTVNLAGAGPDGQFGTPDDISRTTTTDANGKYSFPGLPAGSYRVSVNNPAGLTPTQTQPQAVGLGAGQTIDTLDFGFTRQQGSIGDTVYTDTNGNSTQNSGETGISGVTVNLIGAGPDGQFGTSDDFTRTTTTDSNGKYSFTGLPGGNYRVTVNNPAGLTATQTQPDAIALGNGQNIDTVDFGFNQQSSGVSSIGDTVFNDTNGNGVQDQGEPGIGGVTINLRDSSGNIVTTTTTNSNGNYSFPNLAPGNYTVSVPNPPAGFTPTLVPSSISLQPGQNVDTADFGFTQQPRGTIGDTVFSDTNGNSTQEPGEPGIPGLTVLVRDSSGNTVATTNTDANGKYSVNVPPGTYTVAVTNPPSGFTPTLTQPNPINVGNGQNIDTVDFGFRPTSQGSIGDTVFQDLNGNGVQDSNDVGLGGVRVRLFGPGPDGIINTGDDNQIAEQFTDGTPNIVIGGRGNYTFNNLPPGVYRVESDTPPGNPPNDTATLTTGRNPIIVNLAANQNFLNADFGFNMTGFSGNNPGSIGDTVFNDRNNNGVQDSGEPGIPNVPLTLTLPGPDGRLGTPDDTTQTTTTNSNGNYGFNNLPPAPYRVTITQPFDFPQITTGSPQIDVNLSSGQTLNNVDFGLRRPPGGTIGDFVFNDRNGDRTPNPGETGIPNATVTLRNSSNQIVATTTTNNNGNYIFTGLPLGNYTVDVTRPGGGLNPTTNTTLTANLTEANPDNLNIDFGFRGGAVGQANTGLRLVKRITNVFRNGQPVNITNFNTFVDDPNDNNDNILQQAGRPPAGVTQLETPLQSGDEVEYTISYLAEGDQDLRNVSFCDLIPPETSYSSGEISVNRAGANSLLTNAQDSDQGAFFTPLQPLPQPNQCLSQTNTKGAVIVNLGTITPNSNFGFLRFRVRID
jgi:uncharacterized protein (DUF2141 family)